MFGLVYTPIATFEPHNTIFKEILILFAHCFAIQFTHTTISQFNDTFPETIQNICHSQGVNFYLKSDIFESSDTHQTTEDVL